MKGRVGRNPNFWTVVVALWIGFLSLHQLFCRAQADEELVPTEIKLVAGVKTVLARLDYGNTGFSGNWSNPVLQSRNGRFQFSLQLADVGNTHFCWIAVVDMNDRSTLKWRAPCNVSVEVENCKLVATTEGNIQFMTSIESSGPIAWQTMSAGKGVETLLLDDTGNFIMKRDDGLIVWQSADYPATPPSCLIPGPLQIDSSSEQKVNASQAPVSVGIGLASKFPIIKVSSYLAPISTYFIAGLF